MIIRNAMEIMPAGICKLIAKSKLSLFPIVMLACITCTTPTERPDSSSTTPIIQKIALDPIGQLYTVDSRNTVRQYRADGSPAFQYNNNTLGRLAHIDPTNPFSILLFYPDFQTIILLDRTLNEENRLVLSSLNLLNTELLALSNDNYIWLYDAVDFQLKKITTARAASSDALGEVLISSDNLSLLLGYDPRPEALVALNNRLLLNDPRNGILLFNQFGRYDTTLPVKGARSLQMIDDRTLVYSRDGRFYTYNLDALQERPLNWSVLCSGDCHFRLGKEWLYRLENGGVEKTALSELSKN